MKYHQWERDRYRYMIVRHAPGFDKSEKESIEVYSQPTRRAKWSQGDKGWLDFYAREALERLSELVAPDEWQDGTDDMLTNTERVMETRIDCCAERLEAAR